MVPEEVVVNVSMHERLAPQQDPLEGGRKDAYEGQVNHGQNIPAGISRTVGEVNDSINGQPLGVLDNEIASETRDGNPIESMDVEDSPPRDDVEYPAGLELAIILMAIGLGLIMSGLDVSIIATAIPSITDHFHKISDISWYYSGYRLAACSFQFMFGKMYTQFSSKYVFLVSLFIFELGSLLCGIAPSSTALIFGRVITGLGSSGIIQGAFSIAVQTVPLHKRAMFNGFAAGIEGIAISAAPLLGGFIVDRLSWRWCFYINLPVGAITILAIAIFFKDTKKPLEEQRNLDIWQKIGKLDLMSTIVFIPSIVSLLLALQWGGNTYGWGNVRIIVLLLLFGVLLVAFGVLQWWKQDNALLPLRIIKNRSVLAGMLFSCCNNSVSSIVEYYMPIYFQGVRNTTAARSGVLSLPLIVAQVVFLVVGGFSTTYLGYYTPSMLVGSVLAPISAGLLTTIHVDTSLAKIMLYQTLLGIACGIGWQGAQIAPQTVLHPRDVPMGTAAVIFAQGLGPGIFVAAAQTIFTQRLAADVIQYTPGLNATTLETIGFTQLKQIIPPSQLRNALLGYDQAVTQTFYLAVALAGLTVVGALSMEWRSVKQKKS